MTATLAAASAVAAATTMAAAQQTVLQPAGEMWDLQWMVLVAQRVVQQGLGALLMLVHRAVMYSRSR
jgi:hypothetical protein